MSRSGGSRRAGIGISTCAVGDGAHCRLAPTARYEKAEVEPPSQVQEFGRFRVRWAIKGRREVLNSDLGQVRSTVVIDVPGPFPLGHETCKSAAWAIAHGMRTFVQENIRRVDPRFPTGSRPRSTCPMRQSLRFLPSTGANEVKCDCPDLLQTSLDTNLRATYVVVIRKLSPDALRATCQMLTHDQSYH